MHQAQVFCAPLDHIKNIILLIQHLIKKLHGFLSLYVFAFMVGFSMGNGNSFHW